MKRFRLNQSDTMPLQKFCRKLARRHILEQFNHEDKDETTFHGILSSHFDSSLNSFKNLSNSQEALKEQVEGVSKLLGSTTTTIPSKISNRAEVRYVEISEDALLVEDAINYEDSGKIVETSKTTTNHTIQIGLTTQRQANGTTHKSTFFHSNSTNNHSGTRAATSNHGTCKLKQLLSHFSFTAGPLMLSVTRLVNSTCSKELGIYWDRVKEDWHLHADPVVSMRNTTCHVSIGCTLTINFRRLEPITALEKRICRQTMKNLRLHYDSTHENQDISTDFYTTARVTTIQAYHKYCNYYDRNSSASPLKKHSFCLLSDLQLRTVSNQNAKILTGWLPHYRVEVVLTNSSYLNDGVITACTLNAFQTDRTKIHFWKPRWCKIEQSWAWLYISHIFWTSIFRQITSWFFLNTPKSDENITFDEQSNTVFHVDSRGVLQHGNPPNPQVPSKREPTSVVSYPGSFDSNDILTLKKRVTKSGLSAHPDIENATNPRIFQLIH